MINVGTRSEQVWDIFSNENGEQKIAADMPASRLRGNIEVLGGSATLELVPAKEGNVPAILVTPQTGEFAGFTAIISPTDRRRLKRTHEFSGIEVDIQSLWHPDYSEEYSFYDHDDTPWLTRFDKDGRPLSSGKLHDDARIERLELALDHVIKQAKAVGEIAAISF